MNANDMTADDLVLSVYLQHKDESQQSEYQPNQSTSYANDIDLRDRREAQLQDAESVLDYD